MIIWKNTCGESWQDTIENDWEVSGKPGAFLFFIPKGALTHHLLKQAVVALPLVGHVRSPRGIAAPAGVAGQGCISTKTASLVHAAGAGVSVLEAPVHGVVYCHPIPPPACVNLPPAA